jgi:hypothetical protein
MQATSATGRVVHLTRPNRPALVAADLADLAGPTAGVVNLPVRLAWTPPTRFDLGDPDDLAWLYEIVLREAIHVDELRQYVHGPTLMAMWPALNLPRGVRRAWEAQHPRLRAAAA